MYITEEKKFFLENGYLITRGLLSGDHLTLIQSEFDRVWEAEGGRQVSQMKLLRHSAFLDLIEHPPILDRHRAIFGNQTQLLQYDLLRQGPRNETFPMRAWHRDFVFPGDQPLSVNTILYLDRMTDEVGPTYIVPRTHRGTEGPPYADRSLANEIAAYADPGDAVFINSALWHTGSRNCSEGVRRSIYLYYGYWWLKRYDPFLLPPWQALENASAQRLQLLGMKMPDSDLHMYDPRK